MPSRPIEAHPTNDYKHRNARSTHPNPRQHGHHRHPINTASARDVLLSIPAESLTHITSFLQPPDLFALGQTCKPLHAHVTDDNTWRRAFVYQYFGISPEADLRDDIGNKTLMLRRADQSWKKEFVLRYNLRRRWEYSRNATVTHTPHHSAVTALHVMPNTTLLAASLQYGIVSRSYPLTGKILRGFLDASGTLNGLGIGNPNAEFSPNVSSVSLASEGHTAKVLWGFRHGEVAFTTASRAMDPNKTSAARLVRSAVTDGHEGPVACIAWVPTVDRTVFVSGGVDGLVKIWEATNSLIKCLWTSDRGPSLVRNPCAKVVMDLQRGILVTGFHSGQVTIWTGFTALCSDNSEADKLDISQYHVPAPAPLSHSPSTSPVESPPQEIMVIHLAPGDGVSLLLAYHHSPFLHRLSLNASTKVFERTLFGDESMGPIRSILPVWATRVDEVAFVIAGDQLGTISIFAWDTLPAPSPSPLASDPGALGSDTVRPVRHFNAHEDGAVTALAWNTTVLVSGSSRGTIKTWDALTLRPLRTIPSPAARPPAGADWDGVNQIVVEQDVLVASVGARVLAWKAGPVGRRAGKGKGVRLASGRNHNSVAKWQQQIEMCRDIAESRRELDEEQRYTRRAVGREKEQLSTLAHLGLSEVEAVEYVLMLSRDEEEERRRRPRHQPVFNDDEGVFMPDFEEAATPLAARSRVLGSAASSTTSSRASSFSHSSGSAERPSVFHGGRSFTRSVPSSSNTKVQVSPRVQPEPTEAGFSTSPLPSSSTGLPPPVLDMTHFPSAPGAASRTPSSASVSASGSSVRSSAVGSPQSVRSAWSTPLRSMHSSEAPSPRASHPNGASPMRSPMTSGALTSAPRQTAPQEDEDEDLRFAIELSLAEARSRGEDV